jgi:uncharacterized protein (DUF4415 family)
MKQDVKRNKITSATPLTAAERREIATLSKLPDKSIDYSDIPELDEQFWSNAIRNPLYRPLKRQVTVRLDADVISWLRQKGSGYQTRLNALLRGAMLAELENADRHQRG